MARVSRPRRVVALLALSGAIAAALTACTGGPTEQDRAEWSEWAAQVVAAAPAAALSGQMGGSDGAPPSQADLATPARFGSVELRCIGADRAAFTLSYTGTAGSLTTTQDIVCHGGERLTPVAVPTDLGELTAFGATASSPDGEGSWVAALQP